MWSHSVSNSTPGVNRRERHRETTLYLFRWPRFISFPTPENKINRRKRKENSMSNNRRERKLTGVDASGGAEAAVDELLRAAQDDVLLNLRLNSHSISSDSHFSPLDPDMSRRFDALKSKPSVPSSSGSDVDDLESRFAKLKGGVGSNHGIETVGSGEIRDGGMEAEVEKVMQWAMDAARLDQSGGKNIEEAEGGEIGSSESSDKEDEGGEIGSSESSDEEDEGDRKAKGKGNGKAKAEKKKWFFQL